MEFYDVRAAESALRSLNWSEIAGKQIKLEPGLSGGSRRWAHIMFCTYFSLHFTVVCHPSMNISSKKSILLHLPGFIRFFYGMYSLMQTLSSELEQEESGLPIQHRGSPSNLATGFSGNLFHFV